VLDKVANATRNATDISLDMQYQTSFESSAISDVTSKAKASGLSFADVNSFVLSGRPPKSASTDPPIQALDAAEEHNSDSHMKNAFSALASFPYKIDPSLFQAPTISPVFDDFRLRSCETNSSSHATSSSKISQLFDAQDIKRKVFLSSEEDSRTVLCEALKATIEAEGTVYSTTIFILFYVFHLPINLNATIWYSELNKFRRIVI